MSVSVLTISPDISNSPPVATIQKQSPSYNELEYSFSVPVSESLCLRSLVGDMPAPCHH